MTGKLEQKIDEYLFYNARDSKEPPEKMDGKSFDTTHRDVLESGLMEILGMIATDTAGFLKWWSERNNPVGNFEKNNPTENNA
jgi:hypothetical protein